MLNEGFKLFLWVNPQIIPGKHPYNRFLSPTDFSPLTWEEIKALAFGWLISNWHSLRTVHNICSSQGLCISLCIWEIGSLSPRHLNPLRVESLIENETELICTHIILRLLTITHNLETLYK